jgi:hypothetical protein
MKPFIIFLGLVALAVAGCAAFFSVKGIGLLFAGAAIETMIMASILEVAKLVGTSYLYRYWNKTAWFLRVYLLAAIITLMGITSLGIFGFLSSAYQKSSSQFGVFTSKIESIQEQKKYVTDQLDASEIHIESLNKNRNDAAQRMTDAQDQVGKTLLGSQLIKIQTQTGKISDSISKDIETETVHEQQLQAQSQLFDQQIVDLKASSQSSKDILTFQFIADAIGLPLNTVVKYFIFVIIVVFDPLAVGLVLAYNTAIYGHMNIDEVKDEPKKTEKVLPPPLPKEEPKTYFPPVANEPIVESEVVIETPNEVMESFQSKETEEDRIRKLWNRIKAGDTAGMTYDEINHIRDLMTHSSLITHAGQNVKHN